MYPSLPFWVGAMVEDRVLHAIESALLTGRQKWGLRQLEAAYAEYERGSAEDRIRIAQRQRSQFFFLTKYTAIAGFYEYVDSECSKASMYDRLRQTITSTILRSIVLEEGADLREFDRAPERPSDEAGSKGRAAGIPYTRRRAQDIFREVVPGEFIVLGEEDPLAGEDQRVRPVKSVHAPGPLPDSPQMSKALLTIEIEGDTGKASPEWGFMKELGIVLRFADPAYLRSLKRFQAIVRSALGKPASLSVKRRQRSAALQQLLLREPTPSLLALHHDVESQVALRWWEKRSPGVRKRLLDREFRFEVTQARLKDSMRMHRELGADVHQSFRMLTLAAGMLETIGHPDDSVLIGRFLVSESGLSQLEQAIAIENLAVLLARSGHWKLAIPLYDRAVRMYHEVHDAYREAIALKNRGECRAGSGSKGGFDDLKEAERLGDSFEPRPRFGLHWNLAMAARRLGDRATFKRHLRKCLEDHDHVDPQWAIAVCDLLDSLT